MSAREIHIDLFVVESPNGSCARSGQVLEEWLQVRWYGSPVRI